MAKVVAITAAILVMACLAGAFGISLGRFAAEVMLIGMAVGAVAGGWVMYVLLSPPAQK